MTVFGLVVTLIIGILVFIGGAVTKKKWLMLISIIPLAIVLVNILTLFMMWM